MCPLYTLDITFWALKKTVTLQNFLIFRSQVSTILLGTHILYRIGLRALLLFTPYLNFKPTISPNIHMYEHLGKF